MTFDDQKQQMPTAGESGAGCSSAGIENLLSGLAAIAQDLGLETVLERVVAAACQLVDAKFGALGVIGPDQRLSHFITVGLQDNEIHRIGQLPTGHGVLGLLITEPQPLRLEDLRDHSLAVGFPAGHPQMTTFLGVPIRIHDRVFGNLYLTDKLGGVDFSDTDEDLVVSLAAAAGVAIENSRLFDEASRRAAWLQSGLDAVRELLEKHDEARNGLELLAQHALNASSSDLAMVLRDYDHEKLICEAASGTSADSLLGRQAGDGTLLGKLISEAGGPVLLTGDDLGIVLPAHRHGTIDAALCTQLHGEGDRHFLVCARARGATPFSDVDHEMIKAFTSHVSLALELLRVHRQREQEAVFGDRDRIARDLHDLVIQRLFAAGLSIQSLRKFTTEAEPLERISSVTAELDATIRELRDTIYSLHSVPQRALTFTSSVFSLIADAFDGHDVEPVVQLSGPLDTAVGEEAAGHVRAVLLEGLSNAIRHADAQAVTVILRATRHRLELRIADDGRGFHQTNRHSGLANMQRRAELCGGDFSIDSSPGRGTEVILEIPLVS